MGTKRASFGTTLEVDESGTYQAIAHLEEVNSPDTEVQLTDNPDLDQANGWMTRMVTGIVDPGTQQFNGFFDPAAEGQDTLLSLRDAPATDPTVDPTGFKTKWAKSGAAGTWTYTAFVTKFNVKAALADALKFTCTLALSGVITRS